MTKLYPIIVFSLVFAFLSSRRSTYKIDNAGEKIYINRDCFFYGIMTLGMAIFVGLRTMGNDTQTYKDIYSRIEIGNGIFTGIEWSNLAGAPGLQLVEKILKVNGCNAQQYIMVCALFTIIVYLWFVRKYTTDIWLSVYYFITMGIYTFAMAAIKQTLCVAILLIATDCAIEKKWGRFLFFVALAELFHPFAFVYLLIPFLFFPPWSRGTSILLIGTVVISMSLSQLMGGIMTLTESLGANYSDKEFIGTGVNIFRVMVVWVPVVISFLGRANTQKSEDRATNLIINASMINAMIMFIGLFGTANYFARLANYFLIFQSLALPWVLRIFETKSKKIVIGISMICFMAYFYYQCAIASGAFDNVYAFMSLTQFLTHSY